MPSVKLQIAAVLFVCATVPFPARAEAIDPCSLLTKDEFSQGKPIYSEPTALGGLSGDYTGGVVYLYSGADAQARWEGLLKKLGSESGEKVTVEGVGDNAFAFYPPEQKYVGAFTVVAFAVGEHRVVVAVQADEGQPGKSAHDKAVTLARIAAGRLK